MQHLRDAFRALKATPVVSAVAILSLALGIGANTAIFSILDSLLLRSLPVRDPSRLALVGLEGDQFSSWTYPIWEQVEARKDLFDGAFAFSNGRLNTAAGGETSFVQGLWVSGGYFDVLGVPALLGRTLNEADAARGGGPDGPVAVISYPFWQKAYGGAAEAIGRAITLERVSFTIVGVTPPGFFGTTVGSTFDVAIPLGTHPLVYGREHALDQRSWWWLEMGVRLKPGQPIESGTAALRGVQPQIRQATLPDNYRPSDLNRYLEKPFTLVSGAGGFSFMRSRYERPLLVIMGVVGLVLLVACANIANLLLARGAARRHELSVRLALGASRARLTRQLLVESLVLAGAGAVLGLLFAHWGSRLLVRQLSTTTSQVFLDLGLDWRVLLFTTIVATTTALLFGTVPALRATRVQPNEALKAMGRGIAGERRFGPGNLLVVAQVALSLVLLVAAGLFVRTFVALARVPLGFDRDAVLVVSVNAARANVEPADRAALFERFREAAAAVPGVASATSSVVTPVSGSTWQFLIEVPEQPSLGERDRIVHVNVVGGDFFRTFGTRLIAGRDLSRRDRAGAPPVAIVNEAFARKFYGGGNPIGKVIRQPGSPRRPEVRREIVGYVEDAVYRSLRAPVPPTVYVPQWQQPELNPSINISIRSASGSPVLLTKSVAAALTAVDGDVALTFRPLAEQIDNSLTQERVVAMLSGFFGALALLLAALGLYGVTSYAVSRRRTELGIRMALGARPGEIVGLVLARVALLVGLGAALGVGLSLWASRFAATLLYGPEPRDPVTLVMAVLVLAGIGALAGWLPARRASRIDPARVLHEG